MLQVCVACDAVQYPPREACSECLGVALVWEPVEPSGSLLAQTIIHVSNEPYFKDRAPWRTGLVASPTGISIVCHLLPSCTVGLPVLLRILFDEGGRPVVVATGEHEPLDGSKSLARPFPSDFSSGVRGRAVVFTESDSKSAKEMARLAMKYGAKSVTGHAKRTGDPEELLIRND